MGFTNFPNGVASFGMPVIDALLARWGVCGTVKFVASWGQAGTGQFDTPYTTLAAALADSDFSADRGGAVVCLPGHSESAATATMLDELEDGVAILGIGHGGAMPTFRMTATGSQWVLNNANTVLAGLRLRLEGANGVVKALNITGADNTIAGCDIEVASGASNKATIACEVGSAAHRCTIAGNRWRGTETHNVTDGIKVVGATPPADLRIIDNDMIFSATAGNGLIHVTVASKRLLFKNNVMYNTHTAATATIALDDVASDGVIYMGGSAEINDGTANAQGVVVAGSAVLVKVIQHFNVDEKGKSGVLTPAAAT